MNIHNIAAITIYNIHQLNINPKYRKIPNINNEHVKCEKTPKILRWYDGSQSNTASCYTARHG